MATPGIQMQLSGLARKLVQDGILSDADAQKASSESLKQKMLFVSYLVQNKMADSRKIAQAASDEFGVPVMDIDVVELETDTVKLVKEELVRDRKSVV